MDFQLSYVSPFSVLHGNVPWQRYHLLIFAKCFGIFGWKSASESAALRHSRGRRGRERRTDRCHLGMAHFELLRLLYKHLPPLTREIWRYICGKDFSSWDEPLCVHSDWKGSACFPLHQVQTEIYFQCFQYFQYFKLRCPWTSPNLWLCKTVQPRLMGESSLCPLCHLWLPIKANNFTISQCLYGTEEAWQDQPSFCFGQESQNWARIKNFPWKLEGSN